VIEIGVGADFHGQDVNKAAEKAVKDAISKSCLIGLNEVVNLQEDSIDENVIVNVTVAVSRPEEIDEQRIKECLPVGQKSIKAVDGGLKVPGLYFPRFGDKDNSIEIAVACIEVCVK
jgi:uncharacterized protein (TIGR02058 family)